MQFISTDFLSKKNLLSLVLALFPISFIAGNMIININIILLLLLTLFFYKSEIFKINYFLLDKLIISYFILIIFTGFYNHYFYSLENIKSFVAPPEKSLLFLRYLALYLFLRFLVEKKLINLKFFFISCTFATVFVSLDIFYQYYNGKDIFGFETIGDGRKLGGPFGDELIAGGFIQKFALFSFFLLPIFFPNYSYKISKFLVPLLFLIFMFGVMLSGNRMPMILFILTVFLIVLFQKQTRKFFIPFLIIFLFSFFLLFNFNEQVRTNLKTFNVQLIKMKSLIVNKDFYNYNNTTYLREFSTFYETWLMNKYIGGGIKNFRFYCHHRPKVDKNSKFICNMHPHNYYLEILTETGILGFIIILSIFGNALYLSFFKKYFTSSSLRHNNVIIPFIFLFIAEIFPVKSTGSFFTTGNSTYLFLIIGIMIGLIRSNNLIEKKI
tara:strand:- start:456 stop:1772 length:1317 start_codon:yes stop_codon:yes gene_type:complete